MKYSDKKEPDILTKEITNPIWVSVSEAAKFGGVESKTIRRAIQAKNIKYKIVKDRYSIDLASLINFINERIKLKNKFNTRGLGQYLGLGHAKKIF